MLPIDKNGYWTECESVESCATKTWWRALVDPLETLTNPFSVEILFSKNDDNFFDFQDKLLTHLRGFNAPIPIKSVEGYPYVFLNLSNNELSFSLVKKVVSVFCFVIFLH